MSTSVADEAVEYTAIAPRVRAVRFEASRGLDFARELAAWAGGGFFCDEEHPEDTKSWAIALSYARESYALAKEFRVRGVVGSSQRARPGDLLVGLPDGTFGIAKPSAFLAQYSAHVD